MKSIDPLTGKYTELCNECIGESNEYDFEDLNIELISTEDVL